MSDKVELSLTVNLSNVNKLGYYLFGATQPNQGFLKSAGIVRGK